MFLVSVCDSPDGISDDEAFLPAGKFVELGLVETQSHMGYTRHTITPKGKEYIDAFLAMEGE